MAIFLLSGIGDTNSFGCISENFHSLYKRDYCYLPRIGDNQFHFDCKNVSTENTFIYHDIYPDIDLKIGYTENRTEYDFIIKPSGKIEDIKIAFWEGTSTTINDKGDLVVRTKHTRYIHKKPCCFQMINGRIIPVKGEFKFLDSRTYGFRVNDYRHDQELIIDPLVIDFSTYLGGSFDDGGYGVIVDSSNNIYITGFTNSNNFPTFNAYQPEIAGISPDTYDIFIAKFHEDGTLIFSTFLGGTKADKSLGITLDSSNNILITGWTESSDFPTVTAYQKTLKGYFNAFISKLDNTGTNLDYSTYLGGEYNDCGISINLDESKAIYVVGYTTSNLFPTKNAYQPSVAGTHPDCFITKFDILGSDLVYSTYLGGTGDDYPYSAETDIDGYVYLTGMTTSLDFPTKNAYQRVNGGGYPSEEIDGFVAKLDLSGKSLVYSTYL